MPLSAMSFCALSAKATASAWVAPFSTEWSSSFLIFSTIFSRSIASSYMTSDSLQGSKPASSSTVPAPKSSFIRSSSRMLK